MSDQTEKKPRINFGGTEYSSGSHLPAEQQSTQRLSSANIVPQYGSKQNVAPPSGGDASVQLLVDNITPDAPQDPGLSTSYSQPDTDAANPFSDIKAEIPPEPVDGTKDDEDDGDRKSHNSSNSKGMSRARPLVETLTNKLLKMKTLLFATTANAALFGIMARVLYNKDVGFVIKDTPVKVMVLGSLLFYVFLRICDIAARASLEYSAATWFGSMLTSEKGFSLTGAGFLQTPFYSKVSFSQRLPIKSVFKKLLERLSWIWVLYSVVCIFPIFIATQLTSISISETNLVVNCIYFTQKGDPFDRKWPVFDVESGVGEYVFGNSIGNMRSEMAINFTTAVFPPTIIAAVSDGDIIEGPGFIVDIFTTCECTVENDPTSLIVNNVDSYQVNAMLQKYRAFNGTPGMIFGLNATIDPNNASDPNTNFMTITNIFTGYALCGADGVEFPMVCTTNFTNHYHAEVQAQFMTDGTPASIAVEDVNILETYEPANFTWLATAMNNILEGPVSSFNMQGQLPSTTSPLIWWTTPNFLSVDRAFIDAGIETMYSILFRGALQRTYGTNGMACPWGNTVISQTSRTTINEFGFKFGTAFFVIQLFICLLGLLAHLPWLISRNPIGPAARIHLDNAYFATLMSSSSQCQDIVEMCNSESFEIWQALDRVVRVGESLNSYEDDIGQIVLEKPKVVRSFRNGRRYT